MTMMELLQSRIARFVEDWPTKFPGFDAVLLVSGTPESFGFTRKTVAMHTWLFGMPFTNTVVVLHKFGQIIVWASYNKLSYLEKCAGQTCVLVHRSSQSCVLEDTLNIKFIVNMLRMQTDVNIVIGMLENEIPANCLGHLVREVLPVIPRLRSEECSDGISSLLVSKDAEETKLTKLFGPDTVEGHCMSDQETLLLFIQDKVGHE
jgi:nucleosome binding factor SPN SPT16 subunit